MKIHIISFINSRFEWGQLPTLPKEYICPLLPVTLRLTLQIK
uniref:Uncharacterized protein n=1 Tax=Rhizophora mucronata TaxID=61149 RepID=A0A2P2LE33_RHIMU